MSGTPADALLAHVQQLQREGNAMLAEVVCRQLVQQHAGDARGWFMLGLLLHPQGKLEEAARSFDEAAKRAPRWVDAHMNAGVALYELRRFDDALARHQRAAAIDATRTDVQMNLANALFEMRRHDEALALMEHVVNANPQAQDAQMNMANALRDLRRFDEALGWYDRALAINSANADVRFNRSLCLLSMGDYSRGFADYEARRQVPSLHDTQRRFRSPPWTGQEPLDGKTILVYAEQGLGDTLHVCRYAPLLAERGARVTFEVQKPLIPLMRSLPGVSRLVGRGEATGDYDFHVPLLSLPFCFGTTLENLPARIPYLFAQEERVVRWRAEIETQPGLRIGLVWSGNAAFRNDHMRSMPLAQLVEAIPTEGVVLWSLQKEIREEDAPLVGPGRRVAAFDGNDFVDTAAQMMSLDLIISVETSIAQLAIALGRPTWALLSVNPDWRWLGGRGDNPWYPTARTFRQGTGGEWTPVLAQVREALRERRAASFPAT